METPRMLREATGPHLFLVNSALASACVIGLWVTIRLLEQFGTSLKPFVLAMMYVACLDRVVQCFEWVQIKCWVLFRLCLSKCCGCCCGRSPKNRGSGEGGASGSAALLPCEETVQTNWCDELNKPWESSQAGRNAFIRLTAVLATLSITAYAIFRFSCAVSNSLQAFDPQVYWNTWDELKDQALHLLNATQTSNSPLMVELRKQINSLEDEAKTIGYTLANSGLSATGSFAMQAVMFLIYALLLLLQPIHEGESVYIIVRTYFAMKAGMNALLGISVTILLVFFKVHLAPLVGMVSCFLSFLPEVGFFISMAIPVPLILLDGGLGSLPERAWILLLVLLWMVGIKTVVSNFLESMVMGKNKVLSGVVGEHHDAEVRETHGAIILLAVILCGDVWGPVGMLISVPLISVVRLVINVNTRLGQQSLPVSTKDAFLMPDSDVPTV